jgi:hypothetical protein
MAEEKFVADQAVVAIDDGLAGKKGVVTHGSEFGRKCWDGCRSI